MKRSAEQLNLFEIDKKGKRISADNLEAVERLAVKLARAHHLDVTHVKWKSNRRVMASVGKGGVLNLHTIYQNATKEDLSVLVRVMTGKADSEDRRLFKEYIEANLPKELDETRTRLTVINPKGLVHDLNQALKALLPLLDRPLNPIPRVGWSPIRVGRTGITWGTHRDLPDGPLILVNAVLDSEEVPRYVVEHILWHELCHQAIPPENCSNGRRRVHSKAFREMESRYPDFKKAQAWELKNVSLLIRKYAHRSRKRRR